MTNNNEDLKDLRDKTQRQLDTGNYANDDVKEALEDQLDFLDRRINYSDDVAKDITYINGEQPNT